MDNYAIADQFSLLAKLMDIHDENSFKAKSYASAAFVLEKYPEPVADLPKEKLFSIKGIGDAIGKKIIEIIETGELRLLKELIEKTPPGILEMMHIKGLGPKKISVIWNEMKITSVDELKDACIENRIADKKGFGIKTQQKILEAIQFAQINTGRYLYAQVEPFALALQEKLENKFPKHLFQITGNFRRQLEVIEELEWVTTTPKNDLKNFFDTESTSIISESDDQLELTASGAIRLRFHLTDKKHFPSKLFTTTGSEEFIQAWKNNTQWEEKQYKNEEEIFAEQRIPFLPPYLRENEKNIAKANLYDFDNIILTKDVKGLIHSHSTWSDGAYTIEKMAKALIEAGFEYLVISDHSKAAYYANGLDEEKIKKQHKEIDQINKKLSPFKIYKSIECDILTDGSLDYPDNILSSFDLVIASIHSNLDMTEEKAMKRLMGAITNPYVTIMGHLTGRRLLKRKSYPVDYKSIIDACAEHNVAIEINANPQRLDMEWQWIDYALEKNVLLSINPDAHTIEEFENIKYGVLVAQKGGVTPERNLSSYSRDEFEIYLQKRKHLKQLVS